MNDSARWQKAGLSVLCVFLALVLIVMVFATAYVNYLLGKVNRVYTDETLSPEDLETITEETLDSNYTGPTVDPNDIELDPITGEVEDLQEIINILLVGQDKRAGQSRQRSDVMILCTFNTVKQTLTMTSFMRDTLVYIPGQGNQKMNLAYQLGGFSLLNQTLAVNFGVHVDANVEINFSGFTDLIDYLGGVKVELTAKEAAYMNEKKGFEYNKNETWNLKAGVNWLTGDQALAYARIRMVATPSGANNDFGRTERQRTVLLGLIDSYKNQSVGTMLSMVGDILPMVTTDMSDSEIINYVITLFPTLSTYQINTCRIPASGCYTDQWATGLGDALVPDLAANRAILEEIFSIN